VQSSVTASCERQHLQQAILPHQAHHVLREARGRAAAKAGASTGAAHTARDGHTTPAGATHAGDQAQDRDHFSQVQADLAAGNLLGALGLLDTYWPASARDRAEARAYVAGVIVARLHVTLAPLTMDRMLHTLEPVRPRLDEALTAGHRLRDLLFAAAHGLDHDRLAYALTILAKGAAFVNDETQPAYIAQHYEDLHGAQAYLKSRGARVVPDEPLDPYEHTYSGWLETQNNFYSLAVEQGIADAVKTVSYDPVLYGAWWTNMIGLAIAGAGCLVPELATPLVISATAIGVALQGQATLPSEPQQTFAQRVAANAGSEADHSEQCAWLSISNRIRDVVHTRYQLAVRERWGHYQLQADLLQQFWQPQFVLVLGGGLVNFNPQAVRDKTARDLLLKGAVDKKGVGGHLVYEYSATNVFRIESLDGVDSVYYNPAAWAYKPDKVVLAVAPQLVGAFGQYVHLPISSGDVTAPATIIVTTPLSDGTSFRVYLHLDQADHVTGLSPRPIYWWDGQRIEPLEMPEEQWGQLLKNTAWLATGGASYGARPRVPVSAVAQEEGGVL